MAVSLGLLVCSTPHMPKEMFIHREWEGGRGDRQGGRGEEEKEEGKSGNIEHSLIPRAGLGMRLHCAHLGMRLLQ